jgi:TP901 family phage tail tape measure protein
MQSIGAGMAKTFGAATLAIGGGLTFAVKQAADFDTEMRKAGAIAGASAKELDAMRDSAIELGAKTSESASSVAVAMTEMAAKGFTANETIAAMPGVIAAAEASGEDLALAADTVATALNIFGLEAAESSRVADVLAMTANQSAAGITDMQYALKYAGAPAAALGISLEELSASIGLVVDSGLDGSSAGTALRASLLALNNPAKAQAKIMKQIGFEMQDAEGKTKSLADMIRDMTESTKHMSEADKVATLAKLVGTEAVSGFLALMKAGPEAIEANTKALEESGGAAAETAAQMKDGIGGALEELSGSFESIAIMIGNVLVPYVQQAAVWLTQLAEKFMGLSDGSKNFLVIGTAIAGIFSAIGAGIGIALTVVGSIITALGTLASALGIAGGAGGLLSAIFAALTGPIGIAVAAIAGVVAILVVAYKKIDWFREMVNTAWTKIKEATMIAFAAIKDVITRIIAEVLSFVKPQLDKFKAFWDENGSAITKLVKVYFESIATIIKGVLGIIKGAFEIVWPVITATVKYAWEAIKLVISSAIDIVLGVVKAGLKLLQGDWKGALDSLLQVLKDVWGNVEKFFKGIDLAQTGKDIINGLIKGINSMGEAIRKTVSGLADKIPAWVKKILDIHSPSRVMAKLGVFTGQGLADGIASTSTMIKSAVGGISKLVVDLAKENKAEVAAISKEAAQERAKIEADSATKRADIERKAEQSIAVIRASANKKTGKLSKSQSLRIQNIKKDTAARLAKIETDSEAKLSKIKTKAAEDAIKKESELSKGRLDAIKTYVDDKKSLEQLSLVAESEVWRKSITLFKVGTKERVQAQQEYQKTLKTINDEVVRVNEEYADKMGAISEKLRTDEAALTKAYEDSLKSRTSALQSFAGLFDAFDVKVEQSGADLLANLNAQVSGFKLWQSEIEKLSGKAIDDGLMAELREMGPKALPQLLALNQLTEEQLTQYSALYAEKAALARQQAEAELAGMKEDTALRIAELRTVANAELETLRSEWVLKIQAVTKATNDELSSLQQIGVNAGKGLMNGLSSMEPSLVAKAKSIADSIKAAMAGAFDIHSPSRWMRDVIGVNMMRGWIIGMDSMRSNVIATATKMAGFMTPSPTMDYATPSMSAGTRMVRADSSESSVRASGVTVHQTNTYTTKAMSPSEIAHQRKQDSRRAAMEWEVT